MCPKQQHKLSDIRWRSCKASNTKGIECVWHSSFSRTQSELY